MKTIHIGLMIATLLSISVAADELKPAAQPVRTILESHDQSGGTGKEIVMGSATLPPGSVIGYHTHPGDEAGFVLKGSIIWRVRGQPDRTLKAGDSFFNPRGSIHSVAAVLGTEGGTAVSSWIIDKGQPLATPIP